MQSIHGKDVIGFFNDVPVFCGKDCSFSEEKELIEASTNRSDHTTVTGPFKEFRLRKQSWSMEVTGLTKIDSTDGQTSYFDLITSGVAMDEGAVSISFTDDAGTVVTVSGPAYISGSSINSPKNDFANASVTFVCNGPYEINEGSGVECVPVADPGFSFPDAVAGVAYDFTWPLTGTPPFVRSGGIPIKPSWMIIATGGTVHSGGTPDAGDIGTGFTVRITLGNCGTVITINKTINVV